MTNTLDTPLKTLSFPGLAKGQEQFVLMLRSWGKLSQLGSSWNTTGTGICQITYWNIIAVCRKWYYVYLPAVPLSPLSLVPLFFPLRSANLTIFATPLTGDIWRSKLLSNYFVSCGNVAAAASPRSGDSWRLTGLASLALASVICVQFAALRRMEIEKKLLVSFACVASSGNGDYSHNQANYRLHAKGEKPV